MLQKTQVCSGLIELYYVCLALLISTVLFPGCETYQYICLCIFKCVLKRITNQSKKNRNLSLCLSEVFLKPVFSLEKKKKKGLKSRFWQPWKCRFSFLLASGTILSEQLKVLYTHIHEYLINSKKVTLKTSHRSKKSNYHFQTVLLFRYYIYILHQSSLKPDVQMRCGFLQRLQSYRWFCLVFGLMLWLYWWL